ncbi:hypothetical protein [Virgibacillus pantothenticus]|uniref:hypothetical protein n=1 Tax=Virgibacillus pantothenticus TaxID=1473 RepID=UPI000986FDF3|nr:hypothetical protein [Virgibacillus pantothenticus]
MDKNSKKEYLLRNELNRKLCFSEIEGKLVKVTYGLMADNVYTIEQAIPKLIKIIDLLELEQRAIMLEINRIVDLSV